MNVLRTPLLKAVFALCMGLTLLCVLARPAFTTMQELHELDHAAPIAGAGDTGAEGDAGTDPGLEGVFHAPHCCAHAIVLPASLTFGSAAVGQAPPRFVPAAPRASPLTRFLRPPISV